eukprot:TRINITY_DN17489_c0_g1_i1.p2 TRINITY_DN17489_c0_g1~~TRINITY_DN17489_c0_g1_i1.p2  ORF type:complete len:146 (+),score=3.90 TRINITY_DN17489_c0_g1_i1:113-550(+)
MRLSRGLQLALLCSFHATYGKGVQLDTTVDSKLASIAAGPASGSSARQDYVQSISRDGGSGLVVDRAGDAAHGTQITAAATTAGAGSGQGSQQNWFLEGNITIAHPVEGPVEETLANHRAPEVSTSAVLSKYILWRTRNTSKPLV